MAVPSISSVSLPVQSIDFSVLTGVSPLLVRSTADATTTVIDGTASGVEVSATSFLLSSVSAFESRLIGVRADTGEGASATQVLTAAEELVASFNDLQASASRLQALFSGGSGSVSLVGQFSQAVTVLTGEFLSASTDAVAGLQVAGISLSIVALPGSTDIVSPLVIDQAALQSAVAANLAGTQAAIAGATQSLVDLAAGFEAAVVEASVTQAGLTPSLLNATAERQNDLTVALDLDATTRGQAATLPLDQLANLPADVVANAVAVADLDLAAAGIDETELLTAAAPQAAATTLLTAAETTAATETVVATANDEALNALLATGTATVAPATTVAVVTAPAVAEPVEFPLALDQALATAVTAAPVEVVAAPAAALAQAGNVVDRGLAADNLALRTQLANPARLAVDNVTDPAYAALIAATHLGDFVTPAPVIDPHRLLGDVPNAVSEAARTHGIAYYREIGDEATRRIRGQIDNEV